MVKIYKQPFAHDGDKIAIPDTSQPDGKMSNVDGWTPDYQLPKTDPNYKPVGRQEMNGVFKEVTEALGQVQVQGAASWSADGAPYPVSAQVYHNGKQWLARRANSVEPAEGEDWSAIGTANQLATKAGTSTQVIAGTGLAGGGTLAANRTLSISASHTPLGVGQTWQDVTASRSAGTTYTNTTGRTIVVVVDTGGSETGALMVDNITMGDVSLYGSMGVVPSGSTYRLTGGLLQKWAELR